ncbi:MAG: hypothetical protein ACF8MJ_01740 [Phycisphaerales bacterium JB050]
MPANNRPRKTAARVVMLVCALGIAFAIAASIVYWPDFEWESSDEEWDFDPAILELRETDYDAYLAGALGIILSEEHDYMAITRTAVTGSCDILDLSALQLRPGNYMNEHWDYVCVLSVDGRFLEARRIWNHDYWRWNDEDREPDVLSGIGPYIEATSLMEFCIPRSETIGADQLEVTFVKMKTPEDGLKPIDPSLGWDNFEAYEKVCEATVPISWLVPSS